MNGYLLYRKEGKTCIVLACENDDETIYVLRKLERSRVKWLKNFAAGLIAEFFEKSNGELAEPPAQIVTTHS